jgi:hypothetical protein
MKPRVRPLAVGLAVSSLLIVLLQIAGQGASARGGKFANDNGAFHVDCRYSHSLQDDPIVFPRGPGMSHLHDFVGPSRIDANSTNETIRQDATTCRRSDSRAKTSDRSAYWTPALYVGAEQVRPSNVGAYYKTGPRRMRAIEAYPENLRVIAGDAKGLGAQEIDGQRIWGFECRGATLAPATPTTAPLCKGNKLEMMIRFPDCWDGVHLDSPDHKSHMTYSRKVRPRSGRRVCPGTHPRTMPMLQLVVRYPTQGGPAVRLASGPVNTAHADFMNGWNQKRLSALVRKCLVRDKYCGGGDKPVRGHQRRSATGRGV